jgi:hypothetical protein
VALRDAASARSAARHTQARLHHFGDGVRALAQLVARDGLRAARKHKIESALCAQRQAASGAATRMPPALATSPCLHRQPARVRGVRHRGASGAEGAQFSARCGEASAAAAQACVRWLGNAAHAASGGCLGARAVPMGHWGAPEWGEIDERHF